MGSTLVDQIRNRKRPEPPKKGTLTEFWHTSYSSDGNELKDWGISTLKFNRLMLDLGYCRIDLSSGPAFVRITNGAVVEEVTKTAIQDAVFDYVKALPNVVDEKELYRDMVLDKMLKSIGTLFNEEKMQQVRLDHPLEFVKDDANTRWFFFQNGALQVTATTKEFKPYEELKGSVWKGEILPYDYQPHATASSSVFLKFMNLVCGEDPQRLDDIKRITGYLLHEYHERRRKAVVLTDSALSENNESNGRTGKSLYARGVAYGLSADPDKGGTVVHVSGKDFDPYYRHKWQTVTPYTRLVLLDDIKSNFQTESLYNDITEGLTVQRKAEAPFRQRANLLLTTNKPIRLDGESDKDRYVEFEFSNFFSSQRSPSDHFKQWFFSGWDFREWAAFYALMVDCVQLYLAKGLPKPKTVNLERRKLLSQTSSEFVDFMKEKRILFSRPAKTLAPGAERDRNLDHYYDKEALYNELLDMYPDFKEGRTKLTRKKFHTWLIAWTEFSPNVAKFSKDRDEYRNDKATNICFRLEQ